MIRCLPLALFGLLWHCSAQAQESIGWIGDSITESSIVTGVAKDPPRVLCDLMCPGVENCTVAGEYLNAVAAAPDAPGNGQEYTCASTGLKIRNLGFSGDQVTANISARYGAHLAVGQPLTGTSSGTCTADSNCAAGLVCKKHLGKCGFQYDTIIILAGHNDLRSGAGLPGRTDANGEPAAFIWEDAGAAGLKALLDDACRFAGRRVVVVSVLPWKGGGGWNAGKQVETEALNTLISDYVAAGGLNGLCTGRITYVDAWPYVDENSDDVMDHTVEDPPGFPDGIHPDTTGCEQLGNAVYTEAFQ